MRESGPRRLGLTIGSLTGAMGLAVHLSREAEELGYTDVWTEESGGSDGLTPLAAVAPGSSTLRLGTAILSVFSRPPALLAMSAASLQSLCSGRFVLGLGTSSSIVVERWMGGSLDRPLTRLKEYVEVIRDMLAGKKVAYQGQTIAVQGFRVQLDPGPPVPIYLAALGRTACHLAGRVADGVIFFMKTPRGVRQALSWVAEGAREAGREPAELDCVLRLPVALDEDPDSLGQVARRMLVSYLMVDVYNRSLSMQGYEQEAKAIATAWSAGERQKAVEAVGDEMLRDLVVVGDRERCRESLQLFREAGVKTPVLYPIFATGDATERSARLRTTVRALAGS